MKEPRSTNQRVYESVKQRIIGGAYPPGYHLDASELAYELRVSITPVRIALYRLVSERLVDGRAGEGFFIPQLTEVELINLYSWMRDLLTMSINVVEQNPPAAPPSPIAADTPVDIPAATRVLFQEIADETGSDEITFAVAGANDRLHPVRSIRQQLLDDRDVELRELRAKWTQRDLPQLVDMIGAYHHRRQQIVRDIVAILNHSQRN
jgi:DNA-binding transcriptional MocR family regulator